MDSYTRKRGWFSIGGIIGIPIFLGINAVRAGRLKKLPAPMRAQPEPYQAQQQAWPGQPPPWQGQPQPWPGQSPR